MISNLKIIKRFQDALAEGHLRFTTQRRFILEEFLSTGDHLECEDIYQSLRKRDIRVSRATIYRTLDLLESIGFIRSMSVGDGRQRYESRIRQAHHDHMICKECGTIIEFVDPDIERAQIQIARKHGFRLDHHVHQLYGLCSNCQESTQQEQNARP